MENNVKMSCHNLFTSTTHETAPLFLYKHVILATHSFADVDCGRTAFNPIHILWIDLTKKKKQAPPPKKNWPFSALDCAKILRTKSELVIHSFTQDELANVN